MPRQEFALSYLLTPQDYEKEVVGGSVPLSFSTVDVTGYVMTYSPVMAFDGYEMRSTLLAERDFESSSIKALEVIAAKVNVNSVHITYSKQAESTHRWSSLLHHYKTAEHVRSAECGIIIKVLLSEKDVYLTSMKMNHSLANLVKSYRDSEKLEHLFAENKREHDSEIHDRDLLAEELTIRTAEYLRGYEHASKLTTRVGIKHRVQMIKPSIVQKSDAIIRLLLKESSRLYSSEAVINKAIDFEKESYESDIIEILEYAKKKKQELNILDRIIQTVRDSRAAQTSKHRKWAEHTGRTSFVVRKATQAARKVQEAFRVLRVVMGRRTDDEAFIDTRHTYSELNQREASQIAHTIGASLTGVVSEVVDYTVYGDKRQRISILNHPVILALYGSVSSVVYKSFALMERHGEAARFIYDLQLDAKYGRDSIIRDDIRKSDSKGPVVSLIEKLRMLSDKSEIHTRALERWILATSGKDADNIILELKKFDKVSYNVLIDIMDQAEIPSPEGMIKDIELKLGTNVDMPNRPAGMLETKLAWWDIGFDELLEDWHGKDYLDPPGKDFDYSALAPQVHDSNGIPYQPLGPINVPNVDIKTPISHPFPKYSDIGSEEAWVDLYTFQDMCLLMAITLKTDSAKLAGMTGQQALQYVLEMLHNAAEEAFPWNPEYKRMFRFVRWYAETLAHQESVTVLHRIYDDWRDNIAIKGVLDAPHNLHQVAFLPNGVIEATSTMGWIEFDVRNYIDGQFSISCAINSPVLGTNSAASIQIDDGPIIRFQTGVSRPTFDVPMGSHRILLRYQRELGDEVKFSGLVLTGAKFLEAHTTQRDNGEVRGLRIIRDLINNLLHYYRTHHKNQVKGAEGIKQRKIWLT